MLSEPIGVGCCTVAAPGIESARIQRHEGEPQPITDGFSVHSGE